MNLNVKGVLIDFGGTLAFLDETENRKYEEALISTLKKHGNERQLKDLTSVLADLYLSSTDGKMKSPQEFWSQALKKLRVPERKELLDDLEEVRSNHAPSMWRLFDGVPAILPALESKYKLALVSNCAVGTDKLIENLGLTCFFNCIILSYQVGARKPDKRMYLEALRCLKLEAHECIFVADEISDLEGAKETGLKTMLVRQGPDTFREAKNNNFKPDSQINQISEITKALNAPHNTTKQQRSKHHPTQPHTTLQGSKKTRIEHSNTKPRIQNKKPNAQDSQPSKTPGIE